ncbi:MAG: YvcK family protein [Candidatus Omnitrophica bacterium]|nr:YvcK family protein [Candidatus Omnitrophota bacterium]MBU1933038.1 YvcK family protein [Candidatus Omnitrophota bacterium]
MRRLKWLYPGMKIKRWIITCGAGVLLVALGSIIVMLKKFPGSHSLGISVVALGSLVVIYGIKRMVKSFIKVFLPQREKELVDIMYHHRQLEKGPKLVVIGGGTGLSVLLHGLKEFSSNITAIVTVADDGGSSGRLREQFDILPPGDIRNCLVALADTEPLMRDLFQFRFGNESELKGHSFGNLFITALSKVTGDFEKAIKESSKVLAIRGKVIPSTFDKVQLVAEHHNGQKTKGETRIVEQASPIKRVYLDPAYCRPSKESFEAIDDADVIILGPGSLYTSVVPNLLVSGISERVAKSKAPKVYVCNVMTQPGETDNYTAFDHLNTIVAHTQPDIINYCIVNTGKVPQELLKKYEDEGSYPVLADSDRIIEKGYKVIEVNIVNTTDYVRHDSKKISKIIIDFALKAKGRNGHH